MNEICYDMLYLIACSINAKVPTSERICKYKDLDKLLLLYQFSQFHFVDVLTGTALKKAGVILPIKWEKSIAKSIRKAILFDVERSKILMFMEQKGIWYLPLKGIVIKDFYPSVGMRQMSDNDILFDKNFADEIKEYMVSRGYEVEIFGNSNHDVYKKKPVYNFELHRTLFGSMHDNNWETYYHDVKNRLILNKSCSYGYHMSIEDFYIYIVCHAFKHYKGCGTGIRSLLDFYVYLKKMESEMDFSYVEKECDKLGISEFENKSRKLCHKVFGKQTEVINTILSKEESQMLHYYMSSGVYGTNERMIENNMKQYTKKDGNVSKFKYVLHRLFPGKENYQYCPFVYKYRCLMPIYWLGRIVRMAVNRERRNRVFRELNTVKKQAKKS